MLKRNEIQKIKILFNEGISIRCIMKKLGHSYRTIIKYINDNGNQEKKNIKKHRSRLDNYKEEIANLILENAKYHRKQRRNIKQMWSLITSKHKDLKISERAFRNYAKKLKLNLGASKNAFVPLFFNKGIAQVDFGVFEASYKNKNKTMHYFVMSFPHSNYRLVQAFESENQECFFEAMIRCFEKIGGVPHKIIFDNPSTIVSKISKNMIGNERHLTAKFKELQAHYGFTASFCNPAKGNEKGHVENSVRWSRNELLTPPPKIKNLDKFNESLFASCDKRLDLKHHTKKESIKNLFDEDKMSFSTLPSTRFDVSNYIKCITDGYGFVHVKSNRYSTAHNYAKTQVWVKLTATKVSIYNDNHDFIVSHERMYGKNETAMLWEKYANLLAAKPRAIIQSGAIPDATIAFVDAIKEERFDKRVEMIFDAIEHGIPDAYKIPSLESYKTPKIKQCQQNLIPQYQPIKLPNMT